MLTDVKHRISNADTKRNGSDCDEIMSARNTRGIQRLMIRCDSLQLIKIVSRSPNSYVYSYSCL